MHPHRCLRRLGGELVGCLHNAGQRGVETAQREGGRGRRVVFLELGAVGLHHVGDGRGAGDDNLCLSFVRIVDQSAK